MLHERVKCRATRPTASKWEQGNPMGALRDRRKPTTRGTVSDAVPQTTALALAVIGPFTLRDNGEIIALPPSVERVVAYLALHHGPATRANVAGVLWANASEDRAMASLRSALWRARLPGIQMIEGDADYISLSSRVRVDLYELTSAARDLIDGAPLGSDATLDRLTSADELLGDWYEDWILVEREHFRQLRLQALERLSIELAAVGRFGRAAESALAAIAAEPLRESAHRALIAVHLAQGNHSEAVRQFSQYRQLMREELDLEPSAKMHELLGTPLLRSAACYPRREGLVTAR
jgi:DNA-binding SARP family transcriptional activator